MGRSPCCDKVGLKKGPWTPEEDEKLLAYIEEHGHGNWRALPSRAGLQRCGKSCRLRWTNYLRPDIKRGKFTLQEEQTIIQLHALLGNRWSAIATHLPKRTDNEIKNYWNTHLKKRLTKMGIDPVTHKPKNDALHLNSSTNSDGTQIFSKGAANLSHMAQWESARLEAEARLARQSKLRANSTLLRSQRHSLGLSASVENFPAYYHQMYSSADNSSSSSSSLNNLNLHCSSTVELSGCDEYGPAAVVSTTNIWPTTAAGSNNSAIHHHSPTSSLTFSDNNNGSMAAVVAGPTHPRGERPVVTGEGRNAAAAAAAAMIEFMGGNPETANNNNNSNSVGGSNMIEEEEENWKLAQFCQNPAVAHNDDDEDDGQLTNSISIMPLINTSHHEMIITPPDTDRDDGDNENANNTDPSAGSFIDSFTELILRSSGGFTAAGERNLLPSEESEIPAVEITRNTTGGDGGGDYLEDMGKSYWNSILNLVNSSPTTSDTLF